MAKDNLQASKNLTPVYVALGLMALWVYHLTSEYRSMAFSVSKKNLCDRVKECQIEAVSSNTPLVTRQSGRMAAASPSTSKHHSFLDCFNYQMVTGNPNKIGNFIQNEMGAKGNLPFLMQNGQCGGAGCPHTAADCYNVWFQYAQRMAQ